MSTGPHSQFSIAKGMLIVAGVALIMGVVMTPGFAPILGSVGLVSTILIVSLVLGTRRVMELVYGHRCPSCGRRGLERRAVVSFGERFFFCPNCGIRCRRSLMGAYGLFFWKDASGPEFDALFQKPPDEDPWNAPPGLGDEDEDLIYSKTHLNLVRNKRRRTPDNPNGPGLG